MGRSRNRPPKLDPPAPQPRQPITPEIELRRAHAAGRARIGATELRRAIARIAAGDRRALGELAPFPGVSEESIWEAVHATFGDELEPPAIDPERTTRAATCALVRLLEVATEGRRVAFATSRPASVLGLHLTLARLAGAAGADVLHADDSAPLRIDGRSARRVRWIDGVACATDGASLLGVDTGDAPKEWLFLLPRPALVVADGPYAEVACEAGIEAIAFVGLERPALVVAAQQGAAVRAVPMHLDQPPSAYDPLSRLFAHAADAPPVAPEERPATTATSGSPAPGATLDNMGHGA